LVVVLLRDEDEAALDARESLLRQQLEDAGLAANEVPILRLDDGDFAPLLEVLDAKLIGPSLEEEIARWARPLNINRRRGYEEYIASIVTGEDDEEFVPEFFWGAVLTAPRSSHQPRVPQTRSFSAELYSFTAQGADQVRRAFLPGSQEGVLLHWYVRWPFEEGRQWPKVLSALAEGALQSAGSVTIMPTENSLVFSAVIQMEASLRLSPGMRFLLSSATSSNRVYALGRVIAGL
jgi:hypothetical protein